MKFFIRNIPNILTITRIILTPFIIYFAIIEKLKVSIILIVVASITDLFDGLIARKFNLTSKFGARLDTISDKLFAGCLIITLMIKNILFLGCLVGELLITIINVTFFCKGIDAKTMYIGKIKTTFLFVTICLGFVSMLFSKLDSIVYIFILLSFILQIISSICYLNSYINFGKKANEKTS